MKASTIVLILALAITALAFGQEEAALRPDAIGKDQVGKTVAVEGRIYSNSKSPEGIHLYFGPDSSTAPGLAMFFPVYFGAVPCVASNIAALSPMFAPAARPIPPVNAAAASER